MYDLENDKTKIKGALGPNVIYVDLAHLKERWDRISEGDARAATQKFAGRFKTRGITPADLLASCKLGVAMEMLADDLRLDALCFLGQHLIESQFGAPARIGASMMLETGRHLVACEGDLAGLAMMHAMYWLTGRSPLQAGVGPVRCQPKRPADGRPRPSQPGDRRRPRRDHAHASPGGVGF